VVLTKQAGFYTAARTKSVVSWNLYTSRSP